jgi:hypothetical protein
MNHHSEISINTNMNHHSEISILNELIYNSRAILILFERERNQLKQFYGNKWLLCAVIDGKIKILQSSNERSELEENGFNICGNILFDVLNPCININYKRKNNNLIC